MKNIEKLYQQLSEIDNDELYLIESEFCHELYYSISVEKRPLCITAFLTIVNWFAMSQRNGVWTFYEATSPMDIEQTLQFLTKNRDDELATIFRYGVHDYQNPKYYGNWNYPEEWIEEAEEIDEWVSDHEDWIFMWEKGLLMKYKELICSLIG